MHDVAEVLLGRGAQEEAQNFSGATPLHLAAWFNSLKTADPLLRHGVQVNSKDVVGNSPLHIRTADDAQEVHDGLLPHGSRYGKRGKNVVINLLIDHGADARIENIDGHTSLSIAESSKHRRPNLNC